MGLENVMYRQFKFESLITWKETSYVHNYVYKIPLYHAPNAGKQLLFSLNKSVFPSLPPRKLNTVLGKCPYFFSLERVEMSINQLSSGSNE